MGTTCGQPSCKINNICFYWIKYHLLKKVFSFISYYFCGPQWPWKTLFGGNPMNEKLSKATWPVFAIQSLHIIAFVKIDKRYNCYRDRQETFYIHSYDTSLVDTVTFWVQLNISGPEFILPKFWQQI